ncbi:hypothetical protein FO519_002879 [Halicephalobus sp. NKZ332]|nr:hypothetical protein FO519_002879 [Halicephalobus sp. NKZ332]
MWKCPISKVPQYLLHAGYCKIACTEPRRLACIALAHRVSSELMDELGDKVAYQTRFEKTRNSFTKLLFLTDGLLLRQMSMDHNLDQYQVVILDEVHERQLPGDLLCSLLRDLAARRSDFKLIIMSATINLKLFSEFFPSAPIIQIPGRLYPIQLKYCPPPEIDPRERGADKFDSNSYIKILDGIATKYPWAERGDVLIFLNGMSEISQLAKALKEYAEASQRWIILMLHSTLSVKEQNKVFDLSPSGVRKVILSTNIAEASVTIDEIRFVIDSGRANVNYYDPKLRVTKLVDQYISKASADQRKGRAGRTGPGVCFRLYSEDQYNQMQDFSSAEIQRANLETLILQILNTKLGFNPLEFEYLERPPERQLKSSVNSLQIQQILDHNFNGKLTTLGKIIADLPLDVLVAKLLIYSTIFNQVDVALTIAAGMSVQSPFTNRSWNDQECMRNRESMVSEKGDLFTLINIYRTWLKIRQSGENSRIWCQDRGLEEARLYEIVKVRHQLKNILVGANLIDPGREIEELTEQERREIISRRKRIMRYRKDAQKNIGKRRRVLEAGRHFDEILEDTNNEPSAEDKIQDMEFALLKEEDELASEIESHRMNEHRAAVIQALISIGLYPQCAIDTKTNDLRSGKDHFVRTHARVFAAFHPNSALMQNPEALQVESDSKGFSLGHQVYYFGTFLETRSQYLCNVSKVPGLFSLISSRNVSRIDPKKISADSFLEFTFEHSKDADSVIKRIVEVRRYLMEGLKEKLSGGRPDPIEVRATLVSLARFRYPFVMETKGAQLERDLPGVFDLDGHEMVFGEEVDVPMVKIMTDDGDIKTEEDSIKEELLEEDSKNVKKENLKEFYCENCNEIIKCKSNVMSKVVLEGMNRLPGRLQDLVLDAGMAVNHVQNNSASNETLASMIKNYVSLDNTIENTSKNLDRMKIEVEKLEKK